MPKGTTPKKREGARQALLDAKAARARKAVKRPVKEAPKSYVGRVLSTASAVADELSPRRKQRAAATAAEEAAAERRKKRMKTENVVTRSGTVKRRKGK